MQFTMITLALLACATSLMATPFVTRDPGSEDYVELYTEPTTGANNDSLVYYGYPSGTQTRSLPPSNVIAARQVTTTTCPGSKLYCDSSKKNNGARNANCDSLVSELQGDAAIWVTGRQICYRGDGDTDNSCCVSWSRDIPLLKKADLYPFALDMFQKCTGNGISGRTTLASVGTDYQYNPICATVCISNRGTHCQ